MLLHIILFILWSAFHDEKCRSLHNAENLHTVFFELLYNANIGVYRKKGIEFLLVRIHNTHTHTYNKYTCMNVYEKIREEEGMVAI